MYNRKITLFSLALLVASYSTAINAMESPKQMVHHAKKFRIYPCYLHRSLSAIKIAQDEKNQQDEKTALEKLTIDLAWAEDHGTIEYELTGVNQSDGNTVLHSAVEIDSCKAVEILLPYYLKYNLQHVFKIENHAHQIPLGIAESNLPKQNLLTLKIISMLYKVGENQEEKSTPKDTNKPEISDEEMAQWAAKNSPKIPRG